MHDIHDLQQVQEDQHEVRYDDPIHDIYSNTTEWHQYGQCICNITKSCARNIDDYVYGYWQKAHLVWNATCLILVWIHAIWVNTHINVNIRICILFLTSPMITSACVLVRCVCVSPSASARMFWTYDMPHTHVTCYENMSDTIRHMSVYNMHVLNMRKHCWWHGYPCDVPMHVGGVTWVLCITIVTHVELAIFFS